MRWAPLALLAAVLAGLACQRGEPAPEASQEEAAQEAAEALARRQRAMLIRKDAIDVLRRGDARGAIARLEVALRADPSNHLVRHTLGQAHHRAGDVAAARDHYQAALEARPDAAVYQTDLAHALHDLGDTAAAQAALARSLELEPRQPRAHLLTAAIAGARGDASAEAEALRRACALDPAATPACAELMRLYVTWDEQDAALAVLERALPEVEGGRAADLWYYAALAHQSRGAWRESVEALGEVLALQPGEPNAILQRASARLALGEAERARAELEALLERDDLDEHHREAAKALRASLPAQGAGSSSP